MTHRANAVAAILPFRICGAMATHLRKSKKGKRIGMTHRSNAVAITCRFGAISRRPDISLYAAVLQNLRYGAAADEPTISPSEKSLQPRRAHMIKC